MRKCEKRLTPEFLKGEEKKEELKDLNFVVIRAFNSKKLRFL